MESVLADALIGQVLDRRYHVRSRIAHGGMATVYLATDTRLDRQVALKVMHAELAHDADFVIRFNGEAKSVARLSHPNIVAVFDQGSDGQYLYLAMEYVPGRTLRSLLRERGPMRPEAALNIMDPILSGLAAAHAAGIVHRDVKPENVLLTADGRVKVVDFGLARAQAAAGNTRSGLVIGTVAYIAPEQVKSQVTDARTDVYAAGVLLFELLTGRQPHTGDSPLSVAYKHVNSDIPAPSEWVDGVPPALDRLVRAATSRDPRRRPADAAVFLHAVRTVQAGGDPAASLANGDGTAPGGRVLEGTVLGGAPYPGALPLHGPATDPAREHPYGPGNGAPYGHPNDANDGVSHTMVVPGGTPPWADPGGDPAGYAGPGAHGRGRRGRGRRARGGGATAGEPFLQRWLFSRRLAYVTAAAVAVLAIGILTWWLTGGQDAPVPSVAGLSEAAAVSALRSDGFAARVGPTVHNNVVPAGDVVSYTPSGSAGKGATVTLTLSSGPVMIKIPPVTGQSFAGAVALLRKAGLTVSDQPQKVAETGATVGSVSGTNPPTGTSWPASKTVYVEVVAGPPVPNLVGQSAQSVQANWAQPNGVTLVTKMVSSSQPAGIIVSQSPAPNSVLGPNETVTVNVSSGPPSVSVPDVKGENLGQATQALQQAGFVVSAHRFGFGKKVFYYSPTGTAQQGSTINVYYGL
ncbi:MAG TPA: protein kinase [Trebonia sp.]|jgi:serine/threonine-protein kinase|nr:protein kinase [Trebonia sp.]